MTTLKQRIERILELRAKATPGPWKYVPPISGEPMMYTVCRSGDVGSVADCYNYSQSQDSDNAYFIAAAHDMADLLAELLPMVEDAQKYRQLKTPEIANFVIAVEREALHQRDRWGVEHDAGKTDADWFWLVGYLAGKALNKPDKALHHIITTAAACLNWHAAKIGAHNKTRPGIDGEAAIGAQMKKQWTPADCGQCEGNPNDCDIHDCGAAHKLTGRTPMNSTVGCIDKEVCTWTCDHDSVWSASCGIEGWIFEDGSPSENGYKFCHECGKPIQIVERVEVEE